MIINLPYPPSNPKPPQIHTRKNHDTYNGTFHLPYATHVRVTRVSNHYTIILFYPHNRACEIHRSYDDFLALDLALRQEEPPPKPKQKQKQKLKLKLPPSPPPPPDLDREYLESRCSSPCRCTCSGAGLNCFLEGVLKRVWGWETDWRERRKEGGDGIKVAMEWYVFFYISFQGFVVLGARGN